MEAADITFDATGVGYDDGGTGISKSRILNRIFDQGSAAAELSRLGGSFLEPNQDDGTLHLSVSHVDVESVADTAGVQDADESHVTVMVRTPDLTSGTQMDNYSLMPLRFEENGYTHFRLTVKPA